ncbi:MAG: hypothetical protein ACOYXU_08040 [Nitrospirota bacterium]
MRRLIGTFTPAIVLLAIGLASAADPTPAGTESGGSDANVERFLMEGTEIQGTLEQPHVVYVVPWKNTPSAVDNDIPLRRSFEQELLEPVDRTRFQRQLSRTPVFGTGGGHQ